MEDNEVIVETEEEVQDPKALLKAHKELKKDFEKYKADAAAYKAQLEEASPKTDKYKSRAIKAEAKIALADLGVKNVDRVLKYIDMDDLDFDDEGNLPGLQGKVASLKDELPELFTRKLRAGDVDQGETNSAPAKVKSATELQYELYMKGR
jgi:hypothetical protein